MNAFDAIAHAMTTSSTGDNSTHDARLAYFDSPLIESIAVVFMVIGGATSVFTTSPGGCCDYNRTAAIHRHAFSLL